MVRFSAIQDIIIAYSSYTDNAVDLRTKTYSHIGDRCLKAAVLCSSKSVDFHFPVDMRQVLSSRLGISCYSSRATFLT